MRGLTASDILKVWEWGRDRHMIDRALLLLNAADPSTTPEALSALTVGQRDARLLALRAATFGDAVEGLAECIHCSAALGFVVQGSDLLVPDQPQDAGEPVEAEAYGVRLTVRPPDSRDLTHIAAAPNVEVARQLLLRRCIKTAVWDGAELAFSEIPESVVARVPDLIAARDPQADITLALNCQTCGQAGEIAFDIARFFWMELAGKARRLLHEVHALASAYGWSEADILALSPERRRMYVEVAA